MNIVRQIALSRPRLSTALIAGLAFGILCPSENTVTRILVGWNVTSWSYLFMMGWLMMTASHARVRQIAQQEDKGAIVILAVMSLGALASLAAIILELSSVKELLFGERLIHYTLTIATVLGSWLLLGTLFTFHYALAFYKSTEESRALRFPDNLKNPNYWDFLYFSFTIAVGAQTSDVSVMSHALRKTVLAQAILSFFFNVAIIGLSINLAAGVISA